MFATGLAVLWHQTSQATAADEVTTDAIVLPIAILILGACFASTCALFIWAHVGLLCAGYNVKSWRLMIIALLNVVLSLLSSFLVMLPLSLWALPVR